ncbi:MAP kinase-activated kinase 2 isoform X1 [Brachionus plicatilis]|uniref:non-specific serine/threonine protein kinase n=1 Tax=Brachionus plicatilis TaxID=10195 RepID=A0A3M7QKN0_BRAPC|nr:MAP kinase-activated kinase 2 isoform X1 [Brachionus plicatilis]
MGNQALLSCKSKRSLSMNRHQSSRKPNRILSTKTTNIENDYIISKGIGEGMNGKVYLVINRIDKAKYALKKLEDSKQARREIDLQWRSAQTCDHIVKIVDVYENKINSKKYLLVVLEYMEGGELFDRLKKKKKFTEQEVAKIMKQVCTAVSHLHKMGIAHRDLKPENLLLTSKDENAIIKLSDFGFAKEACQGLNTPNFTPYYVPPEILLFEKYDISCDIWSLGVIMYILCCGYPPFYSYNGDPISPGMKKRIKKGQFNFPDSDWLQVSDEAKELISGMLETVPEKRLNIDQVMHSRWMLNSLNLPRTKLRSIKILNDKSINLKEIDLSMGQALGEMRINDDKVLNIKNIESAENPLLKRRLKKLSQNKKTKILENLIENIELNPIISIPIQRSLSMPLSPTTQSLVAFYYTSNLKNDLTNTQN